MFPFEIRDPVLPEMKLGKAVDKLRVPDAESQNSSLRPVKPGAGHGNALVEAVNKMFEQRSAGEADVRIARSVRMQLRMRDERMEQLIFLLVMLHPVIIQKVV
jgi:hypothetical protein